MAAPILVGPDVAGGAQLLAKLDQERLPIVAAFWRYLTSESDWRFVNALPLVDREGSLPVYERIQAALQQLPGVRISLREIVAVGEQEPIVRHLRQSMPPAFAPDHFDMTLTLPNYAPYSPSLAEHEGSVRVYVYRLVPSGNTDAERAG
jgi:hypothetical protein